MGINNSQSALRPELLRVYVATLATYNKQYPGGYKIGLNETSRSEAVQTAYYARGRESVVEVQRLYKLAGLYAIGAAEAAQRNTNARYGDSAHNFDLARALDIKVTNSSGAYLYRPYTCRDFWLLFEAEAKRQNVAVTWGGTFRAPDYPHIQLTGWQHLK